LEHERKLHLPGAEQLADGLHAVEEQRVDDVECWVALQRLVEVLDEVALLSVDDVALELFLDRQIVVRALRHRRRRARNIVGEQTDEVRQRIEALAATVVDQVERRGSTAHRVCGSSGGSCSRGRSRRSDPPRAARAGTRC
jgi:hypothetical protein